jgi:hypothetical protein
VVLPEGHYDETCSSTCGPLRGETLHVDVNGNLTLCCLHSQVPTNSPGADVAGNLHDMSLVTARARLWELIGVARERLTVNEAERSDWSHFGCNRCLKNFGRPHWTDEGASGARAVRERWRGARLPQPDRHRVLKGAAAATTATPRRLRILPQ